MLSFHEVEHRLDFWGSLFGLWHVDEKGLEILWTVTVGGTVLEFSPKTLIMTWLVMIVVLAVSVLATRNMNLRRPNGLQNVFEMLYEAMRGQINQAMDPEKGKKYIELACTFFIFILFCNLIGLIPTLMSPTANPNTTAGFALITFSLIWFYGIKEKGIGYFKHWFKPVVVFLPLNLLEEFVKPVTLAARLFGNIYAGEVLICTWLGMFLGWHMAFGWIVSVVWLAFSIFVGFIQAFVFTVLTVNYIAMATADDH
ncbi:MAG: F0F1 ATP synthase subunit A [Peptococcaceae bacterium]|nr:F0F1 ATP synthase subunit A [Peptococcaceae bacterium]